MTIPYFNYTGNDNVSADCDLFDDLKCGLPFCLPHLVTRPRGLIRVIY